MGAVNIWRDTVTYDELTINERQKTDQKFSEMLDKVRLGFPDDETLATLSERVFSTPIENKLKILQQGGNAPVCLFPKVDMCKELNETMLANLPSPTIKIRATNLIDGTGNLHGLVNGALGTVQAISETRITVKFDRITDPCEIEKVKRKFMVMKNVFVYGSQFPLILAFAVTIHKCQGLSLDNAIIDLSENVFSA
uniref:ATP-dependent DNA helicase n=1 Tax=Amphimedon queenslandica TaxID=400682 RepID=A0A1X7V729_AMPQE